MNQTYDIGAKLYYHKKEGDTFGTRRSVYYPVTVVKFGQSSGKYRVKYRNGMQVWVGAGALTSSVSPDAEVSGERWDAPAQTDAAPPPDQPQAPARRANALSLDGKHWSPLGYGEAPFLDPPFYVRYADGTVSHVPTPTPRSDGFAVGDELYYMTTRSDAHKTRPVFWACTLLREGKPRFRARRSDGYQFWADPAKLVRTIPDDAEVYAGERWTTGAELKPIPAAAAGVIDIEDADTLAKLKSAADAFAAGTGQDADSVLEDIKNVIGANSPPPDLSDNFE